MAEAHRSYSQDFEASCVEADAMVDLAQDLPGFIGARLTGGGFGGCTINLVEQNDAAAFAKALARRYAAKIGIVPQIHICHASEGAHQAGLASTSKSIYQTGFFLIREDKTEFPYTQENVSITLSSQRQIAFATC